MGTERDKTLSYPSRLHSFGGMALSTTPPIQIFINLIVVSEYFHQAVVCQTQDGEQ